MGHMSTFSSQSRRSTRLKLRDLHEDLRQDICLTLKQYTVPLVGLRRELDGEIGELCGSGTLVTARSAYYILTASHVWHELSKFPALGMSLADYKSRFT